MFGILRPLRNDVRFEYFPRIPEFLPNVQGLISFHFQCFSSLYSWMLNECKGQNNLTGCK